MKKTIVVNPPVMLPKERWTEYSEAELSYLMALRKKAEALEKFEMAAEWFGGILVPGVCLNVGRKQELESVSLQLALGEDVESCYLLLKSELSEEEMIAYDAYTTDVAMKNQRSFIC